MKGQAQSGSRAGRLLAADVLQVLVVLGAALMTAPSLAEDIGPFRPPAVPLVACNPYFSVWSMADRLTDDWTRHWTGTIQGACGMARIDGKAYRFLGPQPDSAPAVDPMQQESVEVLPTRTLYRLAAAGIELRLTFMTPALPHDLDHLAWPVTYVTWTAKSTDRKPHTVSLYLDITGEWAVDKPDQQVVWRRENVPGMAVLRIGSADQAVLKRAGDNLRIEWGYAYLSVPTDRQVATVMAGADSARRMFADCGELPPTDDTRMPRAASDGWPVLACVMDLGKVGASPISRHVILAYDDLFAIEYMHQRLRPYWRRSGMDAAGLLAGAERDYPGLTDACGGFDRELMADLRKAGGEKYARLAALAYRQCLAAHGLAAGPDGSPMLFPKENFSNGCISTVDVIYPSSPFFLLLNTELMRALLTPVLEYASSPRWKWAFAPHDLGTYPLANGQVYGGGERTEENQMPVEESGNMLIILAAMARIDGNADYANHYWPALEKWAHFLLDKGLDPENQLCTDDFAGHLAHNANLSLKAIVGLDCFAGLCDMTGRDKEGLGYHRAAHEMAKQWVKLAADGNHFRLAFDKPGSWSQKYNLIWDRVLGLKLFPPSVVAKEMSYYKPMRNLFGLPLDSRKSYAKLDWSVWTASLARSNDDFHIFMDRLYDFADRSTSRVPLTDWYETTDGRKVGFQARSVVGGVYMPMLREPTIWNKWADRAKNR